jgi:hypothetical protein
MEFTTDQIRRIKQSISDCEKTIKKEMSISEDLRNNELIKSRQEHINRMYNFLSEGLINA